MVLNKHEREIFSNQFIALITSYNVQLGQVIRTYYIPTQIQTKCSTNDVGRHYCLIITALPLKYKTKCSIN